jgi:hypothetical protein
MLRIFSIVVTVLALSLSLVACQTEPPTPALEVEDQDVQNNNTVTISHVTMDKVGWLIIHPATEGNGLDSSTHLSLTYLSGAGTYSDLDMRLAENITEERTLFAMLHSDDPLDQEFTFKPGGNEDMPIEVEGDVMVKSFVVSP